MGTFVTITAVHPDRDNTLAAVSEAFERMHEVDQLMSIHRPESELSKLNASGAREFTPVSKELFTVLWEAQRIARATAGSFDVTLKPLVDLWGFQWKRNYQFPPKAAIDSALAHVDFQSVELDESKQAVRFNKPGLTVDVGGIAKGFAVDQAILALRRSGISNAMVKAGGDLRVIGAPPGAAGWTVQLEDPRKKGHRVAITLKDQALSTSGNYENYFEHEGQRYSHILDPRTGMPVQGVSACTVIADTCIQTDALATALMVLGPEEAFRKFSGQLAFRFWIPPEAPEGRWKVRQTKLFPPEHGTQ